MCVSFLLLKITTVLHPTFKNISHNFLEILFYIARGCMHWPEKQRDRERERAKASAHRVCHTTIPSPLEISSFCWDSGHISGMFSKPLGLGFEPLGHLGFGSLKH